MASDSSGNKRRFSHIESTTEEVGSRPFLDAMNATQLIDYVSENKIPENPTDFKLVSSRWYSSFLLGSRESVYLAKGYAGEKLSTNAFDAIVRHYGLNNEIVSCRVANFSELDRPFDVINAKLANTVAEVLHLDIGSEVWAIEIFSVFLSERILGTHKRRIIALEKRFEELDLSDTESLVVFPPSDILLGRVGLSNMGNTCFMNSSLQILLHMPELIQYFLSGDFLKDLNPENPIGCQGQVANAFAQLFRQVYDRTSRPKTLRPADFIRTIGKFHRPFASRMQQDSQEFTVFLLDGLHEDLNRIYEKPSTEKPELPDGALIDGNAMRSLARASWDTHHKRNDSKIMDLFTGMYMSTLVCPECEMTSITYDPFFDLTLPLPTGLVCMKPVTFVPCISSSNKSVSVTKLDVALRPSDSVSQLKDQVVDVLHLKVDGRLVAGDVYASRFFRILKDSDTLLDSIDNDDEIVVYELPTDKEYIQIPVYLRQNNSGFAFPFFISVQKSEASVQLIKSQIERSLNMIIEMSDDKFPAIPLIEELQAFVGSVEELVYGYGGDRLHSLLPDLAGRDTSDANEEPFVTLRPEQPKHERIENLPTPASSPSAGPYSPAMSSVSSSPACSSSSSISPLSSASSLTETRAEASGRLSSDSSVQADQWLRELLASRDLKDIILIADISPESVYNADKFAHVDNSYAQEARDALKEHEKITLDDCLRQFSQSEVLGDQDLWFCPRCKDSRKARKQLKLWSTPDILMVHLKRFSGFHNMSRKLDGFVDFPLEGLDLAEYVSTEAMGDDTALSNDYTYDLYAVDNHFGGMGGGHYTSFVKDPFTQKWLDFNDSFVTQVDASRVLTEAAYLLFYRKRATFPSGDQVEKLSLDIRSGTLQKQCDEQMRIQTSSLDSPSSSSSLHNGDTSLTIKNTQSDSFLPASMKSESVFKGEGRMLGTINQ